MVTAACFTPNPSLIIRSKSGGASEEADRQSCEGRDSKREYLGEVFVSADFTGAIKVFKNKIRPPSVDEKK